MPTSINYHVCSQQLLGTGLVDCEIKFGQVYTILRVSPSWTFNPSTETFNLAYVIRKIEDGTFTPFLKTLEFTNNTGDPTTKEYQGGDMAVIRNAKPQYMFEYDNGLAWHKASYSFNGFQSNSVILIDKQGNAMLQQNVAGTQLTAFGTNMFNTRTYVPVAGDETAKTLIEFQIQNEEAFNRRSAIITADQIGADLNEEIKGIVNVTMTGIAYPELVTVTLKASNNTGFGIEGLNNSNFIMFDTVSGDAIDIASVTAVAGQAGVYEIVPDDPMTVTDQITVQLYDSVNSLPVAVVNISRLYKGEVELSVQAAPST